MLSDPGPGPRLRRALTLPLLVLYGLGTTVGAGIYALSGAVAGRAGMAAPAAYVAAAVLAGFTALAFAELARRVPRAAGEAAYVRAGLDSSRLATVVGLLVVAAACVSAATVANGFVGYLQGLVGVPRSVAIVGLLGSMGVVAAWGIRESALVAAGMTLVEVFGLVLVLVVGGTALAAAPARLDELFPVTDAGAWGGVLTATLLAFYAFLGFEDMVNVAEEVQGVERTLPRAIILTLGVTVVLYVLVVATVVLVVPPQVLAASDAPLALAYERATGRMPVAVTMIGTFAMVNGALVQLVKGSRVLFGLADQGTLPRRLAAVHPRTRTPLEATLVVTLVITTLALAFPLTGLAEATAVVTLTVFALVHMSLMRMKWREPAGRRSGLPLAVPVLGLLTTAGMLAFEVAARLGAW